MVKGHRAALVEAFSDQPLGGNGAAVVLLEQAAPDSWMQGVARSLQQSETAFVLPLDGGHWGLRWFTPSQEVKLCGHATLAATLALGAWGVLPPGGAATFSTRSGALQVSLVRPPGASTTREDRLAWIELPHLPLTPQQASQPLVRLLVDRLRHAPERFWHSPLGYQVALLPSTAPLSQLGGLGAELSGASRQGLVVMQPLGPGVAEPAQVAGRQADYQLRFFAPGLGIEEDPVTGSAHALVAPYWMEHLQRPQVVGWQCSDRPGGMVCEPGSSGMIRLTGAGHLLWEGTLWAEPGHSSDPFQARHVWDRVCGR
ncbi:MAG: PhzF family phenazine biosynthesis protein [Cyanobacteriota bacterium]|nr:PhzF family phenazine biosynthesis protein [Cyanobacteriota bacterium]